MAWDYCVSRKQWAWKGFLHRTKVGAEQTRLGLGSGMPFIVWSPSDIYAVSCLCSALITWSSWKPFASTTRKILCQSRILPTWEQFLHSWDEKNLPSEAEQFRLPESPWGLESLQAGSGCHDSGTHQTALVKVHHLTWAVPARAALGNVGKDKSGLTCL